MILTVSRKLIYNIVSQMATYHGAKMPGATAESFENTRVIDDDRPMLDTLFNMAAAEAVNHMQPIVTDMSLTCTRLQLTLKPGICGASIDSVALKNSLELFLANTVAARWFGICHHPDADRFTAMADTQAALIRTRLLSPTTRTPSWL